MVIREGMMRRVLSTFSSYCPLQIWALTTCIKDEKFCNQDFLKTITARSFQLFHLVEDHE